ncbi:MAG: hypothetical protein K6G63_07985, partial [Eubacterium sp.]|nr:hypothetical protein [Eubacterium sp.]
MELFIVESLRYVIVLLFAVYTFYCFFGLRYTNPEKQNGVYTTQQVFTVLLHLVMSVILIMENKNIKYIIIWIIG